jgi:hypothetical protein
LTFGESPHHGPHLTRYFKLLGVPMPIVVAGVVALIVLLLI